MKVQNQTGIKIDYDLASQMWLGVRGKEGRMWYAGGWIWLYGYGHITRLQYNKCDFGISRFDINKQVLQKVRKGYYAILLPEEFAVYDQEDMCVYVRENNRQPATYKWEQYMNPGVSKPVGYSFVELDGLAKASDILRAAVPGRKCGFTCECIEDAHNIVRMLTQNETWKVESLIFADDAFNPKVI